MKFLSLKIPITALAILSLLSFQSCKDKNTQPSGPTISGFLPTSGVVGAPVTINGFNFGTNVGAVKIKFNGIDATVISADALKLTTMVPTGATTGEISVNVSGIDATLAVEFTVITVDVTTLAGSVSGFADGQGTVAQFNSPQSATVDATGNIYVTDFGNQKIRKLTPYGIVSTLAGSSKGFADGQGSGAQFSFPFGIAVDGGGIVYVADEDNNKIRKILSDGSVTTVAGSTRGYADLQADKAMFNNPTGVAVDGSGNVYVADPFNYKIRKITTGGFVISVAGNGLGFGDGVASNAQFAFPGDVAVDAFGNVYVADKNNHKIRKITPDGFVNTIAGSTEGYADGLSTDAQFSSPSGIAVQANGTIFIADSGNNKIRKMTPDGYVSTLAGNVAGFKDGDGATALFQNPSDVAVSANGEIYVVDNGNHRIRKIIVNAQ